MLELCGFKLIDENWRSCYWNQELGLYLVVYVDDFSMSGKASSLAEGWRRIKERIALGDVEPMSHFLGCKRVVFQNGNVRGVKYDMRDFWLNAVQAYKVILQSKRDEPVELLKAQSPYINAKDNGGYSILKTRLSETDPWLQCCYCGFSGTHDCFMHGQPGEQPLGLAACKRSLAAAIGQRWNDGSEKPAELSGEASSIVMRLLYGARMCRHDLLFAIQRLASKFTKWTSLQDKQLWTLMSYI